MPVQTTTNAAPMLRFPYGRRRGLLAQRNDEEGLPKLKLGFPRRNRRIGGYQPRVAL